MVIVESKFDENLTKSLNKIGLKRLKVLLVILSLFFILLGVINLLGDDTVLGVIVIVIGVLYIPLVILLTKIIQKRRNKTLSILSEQTTERYEFDEDFIVIKQQKGEDFFSETKAKYNYLFKAFETKDDFILYISNIQAHVVPKSKIIEGTVEELREILINNLKDRFKILK